jgi:hypothetical protein
MDRFLEIQAGCFQMPSGCPKAIHNEISWQSAFWSLPLVALSIMLQPGGHPFSADIGAIFHIDNMFARASPFFCAADSLNIITLLFVHRRRSGGFTPATWQAIWKRRFRDARENTTPSHTSWIQTTSDFSTPTQAVTVFESLQNSTKTRWLAFAVGTLPQLIKIHACRNVTWTKLAMAAYVSNFLLVELLALISSVQTPALGKDYLDQSWYLWIDSIYFGLIGVLPTTIFMMSRLALLLGAGDVNHKSSYALLFGLYLGIAMVFLPFRLATPLVKSRWFRQHIWDGAANVWGKVDVSHSAISTAVSSFHVLLLGVITYFSYAFLFDPRGTSKPGWTDFLG